MVHSRRRRDFVWIIIAAALLVTAVSTLAEAGLTRPLRLYVDDNGAVAATYNVSTGVSNVSFWGINVDYPLCEFQIGNGLCFNGSNTTNQGVWLNGSPLSGGGGLTSVPVVNITGVNVTNGSTHTLTLRKDDGSTLGVTFDDTNTGGGGSFNISNTDTWLDVNNGTGVINFNLTKGYPLTNSTADTCNPSTQYSVWNGTQFTCRIDSTGSGTVTFVNVSTQSTATINVTPAAGVTTTGTFNFQFPDATTAQSGFATATQITSLNAKALAGDCVGGFVQNATTAGVQCGGVVNSTLPGILSIADYVAFSHAGSSNLTSVVANNITGVNVTNGTTHTLSVRDTAGNTYNVTFDDTTGSGGNASSNGTTNAIAKFNGNTQNLVNSTINDVAGAVEFTGKSITVSNSSASYSLANATALRCAAAITYPVVLQHGVWSPIDAFTYYMPHNQGTQDTNAYNYSNGFIVSGNLTLKKYSITYVNSGNGVVGSNETVSFDIMANSTVQAGSQINMSLNVTNQLKVLDGLNLRFNDTNQLKVRMTSPTWATNPTQVRLMFTFTMADWC